MFREVSIEERKRFYNYEWNPRNIPKFIIDSLSYREFAFDYTGEGPGDRYRKFENLSDLETWIRKKYPYAIYSSVAFYEIPEEMENWIKAELVFDLDVKDMPIRTCNCNRGNVCETCLNDSKDYVFIILDALKELGLKDIHVIFSGRGYHIRVLDECVTYLGSYERGEILKFVIAMEEIKLDNSIKDYAYYKILKRTMLEFLKRLDFSKDFGSIKRYKAFLYKLLESNDIKGMKKSKIFKKFMDIVIKVNREILDSKVTLDLKRLIRLPSTLHSKIGLICMEVKNLYSFNPIYDARPKIFQE